MEATFPADFIFGTATAALQVEGAVHADGSGESVWSAEGRKPGKIRNDDTIDLACDQYHRYREDVALMRELGVQAYRFSINWSRVFPDGVGKPNEHGLDYYQRLIDELLKNGIQPWVTMYHWDLPMAMQEKFGGWINRATPEAFADYVAYTTGRISDRVTDFFTVNEIECFTCASYNPQGGRTAPSQLVSAQQEQQAVFHGCLAHGLAMQAIRANARQAVRVGIAQNPITMVPAFESEANIAAAKRAFRYANRSMLTMICEGKYMPEYLAEQGANAPVFREEDLKIISAPMDFLGTNIYTAGHVLADENEPMGFRILPYPEQYPKMDIHWERIVPETLYWSSRFCRELWNPKEIIISENGCAAADSVNGAGEIMDTDRVLYLREYLHGVTRAIAEGIPVRGYFLWSLLDNFEWNDGYRPRFGIIRVNRSTLERTPKLSARFYAEVIRQHRIV